MDLSRILKNEILVGEETLLFNTLAEGEVVVSGNEFWSGEFTHEGCNCTVEDGSITNVTDVAVEAEAETKEEVALEAATEEVEEEVVEDVVEEEVAVEAKSDEAPISEPVEDNLFNSIESLNEKVDSLTAVVNNYFESMKPAESTEAVEELSANLEEIKLELKQQTAEAEIMSDAVTDEAVVSEFSVENYRAISDWGK